MARNKPRAQRPDSRPRRQGPDRDRPYRPPPSPPPYDRDRRVESDSWRPGDRRQDLPPRPPRDDYRQAADSYRPRVPQGDFTFRFDKPAGIPDFPVNYRSGYPDRRGSRRDGRGRGRGGRRWQPPPHPSERALISGATANLPEERLGEEGAAKFRDVDELSDDDELDMDISSSEETEGPSKKRAKTTDDTGSGDAAPKWSNPDPYTALPCPDESTRKKRDMVKLIRKARVDDNAAKLAASTEAEDFISFDLTEDESSEEEQAPPPPPPPVIFFPLLPAIFPRLLRQTPPLVREPPTTNLRHLLDPSISPCLRKTVAGHSALERGLQTTRSSHRITGN
ncbi:hypothetical protein ACJ41O_009255 [Fusarium nematophilum]